MRRLPLVLIALACTATSTASAPVDAPPLSYSFGGAEGAISVYVPLDPAALTECPGAAPGIAGTWVRLRPESAGGLVGLGLFAVEDDGLQPTFRNVGTGALSGWVETLVCHDTAEAHGLVVSVVWRDVPGIATLQFWTPRAVASFPDLPALDAQPDRMWPRASAAMHSDAHPTARIGFETTDTRQWVDATLPVARVGAHAAGRLDLSTPWGYGEDPASAWSGLRARPLAGAGERWLNDTAPGGGSDHSAYVAASVATQFGPLGPTDESTTTRTLTGTGALTFTQVSAASVQPALTVWGVAFPYEESWLAR